LHNIYKRNLAEIDWTVKAELSQQDNGYIESKRSSFPSPQIVSDYETYECPVSGKFIEGRKAHEENLKSTGCRLLEPGEKESNTKNAAQAIEQENKKRDAAIDGIVDSVASEYFD
tara:strand:+ start:39 stop:383 length:345 start_codon:yes stop_codon:yes gene_type:complete